MDDTDRAVSRYSEVLKPLKKWLEIGYVLKEEEEE